MIREITPQERLVLSCAMRYVDDRDDGYGMRVDGTEDMILSFFSEAANIMLEGGKQTSEGLLNDRDCAGTLRYAFSIMSDYEDAFGWITEREGREGSREKHWPPGLTPEQATEGMLFWNSEYDRLGLEELDSIWERMG